MKRFIERRRIQRTTETIAADIARYGQARQHLGPAMVVCDEPEVWMVAVRRQWLKLARELQRRRAFATDAVEILKFTYTITQMQHMRFEIGPGAGAAGAARMVFLSAEHCEPEATNSLSLYVVGPVGHQAEALVRQIGNNGLIVDYADSISSSQYGLLPRSELEQMAQGRWQTLISYLAEVQVQTGTLVQPLGQAEALDEAIDRLLDDADEFLHLAGNFARSLELARPLELTGQTARSQYEAVMILAHRVQCLSVAGFNERFLKIYADDARYLHDAGTEEPTRMPSEGIFARLLGDPLMLVP
jgi:hypothetical protein